MLISGIQKISLVDFDNEVSTTIFLAGCNFRCPFCHNFEFVVFNKDELQTLDKDEVLKYLESRKSLLTGVAITGGEPTLYPDLIDFIKDIKAMGYKVKLDSNGTNPEMIKYLFENNLIDYLAMDIKNQYLKYELTTGCAVDIDKIKESISFLINSNYNYEFRTTLIENYHNESDIIEISNMIKGSRKYVLQKFQLSNNVPNKDLKPINEKDALKYKDILSITIKEVILRGYN